MLNSFEIERPNSSTQQESHYKKRTVKRSSKQSTRKERLRLSNELERRKLETYTQPCTRSERPICNCGCYEREQVLIDVIEFYQRIATFVVVGIVAKIVIDALSERK